MVFKEKFLPYIIFIHTVLLVEVAVRGHRSEMFYGTWVHDNSYPLYNSTQCPFMEDQFNCEKMNRPDNDYMKYRWQPSLCNLPRFDAEKFLRKMKGKRILFVGDSLSVNQWQSLACMIYSSDPHGVQITQHDLVSNFEHRLKDFFLVVDRSHPFLVDVEDRQGVGRVLKLDSITGVNFWWGYNVLVFNMWHSWLHAQLGYPWDYIETGQRTLKNIEIKVAIEKVLWTWAKWVDEHIDPRKTKVFFVGPVPSHFYGYEWGRRIGDNCRQETIPLPGSSYPSRGLRHLENLVQKVLKSIKRPVVYYLNVTLLSQLRVDGHPGIYDTPSRTSIDCDHWCLPGTPDTWNELLSAAIFQNWIPFNKNVYT